MARLAVRLAGPTSLTASSTTTIYTAPAVSSTFVKAVLRQLNIYVATATAIYSIGINGITNDLIVGEPAGVVGVRQFNFPDAAIEAGETLVVNVASGGIIVTAFGANITPSS